MPDVPVLTLYVRERFRVVEVALKSPLSRVIRALRSAGESILRPRRRKLFVTLPSDRQRTDGETVFHDAPLRFRKLTVANADLDVTQGGDLAEPHEGFKIRVARMPYRRREAGKMVERRYSGRGYQTPSPLPEYGESEMSTFLAYDEGKLVGTVTVRLDSPALLGADSLYPDEVHKLREAGFRLCEFTRLAVLTTATSKPVLAGLFHTAFLYAARIKGFTHAVIEVNPRHVGFYQKALGFRVIGDVRINQRVNAPAVLMVVPFAKIAESLRRGGPSPHRATASRSLLFHGFPASDEPGVLARLRERVQAA